MVADGSDIPPAGGSIGRAQPLLPGDPVRLGAYRILGRLGQGGMGAVFLAETAHGRQVAVKTLRIGLASDDGFRRRFRSEVRRAQQVPPFCTAEVLDADPDHEPPYMVVEFVNGPSLADVVRSQGPLTSANLHGLAIGVATALTAIHGAGVIHRDLKPGNVLLPPGTPKVIDFGIARAFEGSLHTRSGHMVGTLAYMAPERFKTSPSLTGAADIFAWGAVVAYAGTGRTPFEADSPVATAARILTDPPDLRGLAKPLRDLVEAALEKRPSDRPDARQLLDLLLDTGWQPTQASVDRPALRDAVQPDSAVSSAPRRPSDARPVARSAHPGRADLSGEQTAVPSVAEPEPVPSAARRRRTRLSLLAAALAVLTAAVVTVTALPEVFRLPTGGHASRTGAVRGRPAATSTQPPASSPRSSAVPNSPAASLEPHPSFHFAQDARIADPLTKPRQIRENTDGGSGCRYVGALRVTVAGTGSYECGATRAAFAGDHRISVEVTLRTAGACAGIWFLDAASGWPHGTDGASYEVNVCAHAYVLNWYEGDSVDEVATFLLPKRTPLKEAHRATIEVRGTTVLLYQDGRYVGEKDLAKGLPADGGVVLLGGWGEPASGDPPHELEMRNLEIIDPRDD